MTQYEQSLIAMKRLLDAVNEQAWAKWIETDLQEWRLSGDVRHHRSAYGGMGSFNDVVICRMNHHAVTKANEIWADMLFQWLKSLCFFLAGHPSESFTAASLNQHIGRHDSSLASFVGGDQAADSMRGLTGHSRVLNGWACRNCHQSEVTTANIEYLISEELIPPLLFAACEKQNLNEFVDRVLQIDIPGIKEARTRIASAINESQISLVTSEKWNWQCPYCQSDDTVAQRWNFIEDDGLSLRSDGSPEAAGFFKFAQLSQWITKFFNALNLFGKRS